MKQNGGLVRALCSIVYNGFAAGVTKLGLTLSASAAHELMESCYIGGELRLSGPWAMGWTMEETDDLQIQRKSRSSFFE